MQNFPKIPVEKFWKKLYNKEATVIYANDGTTELARYGKQNVELVTYQDMPQVLIDALVATEDSRFFQHNGVDAARFIKASVGQLAGKNAGGASTLSMQVIKNTYTLEFLNIPEFKQYSEGDLEQRIIDNLQIFLLELGKGFTFVGRQYKITVNNIHYHVDLVFYHRILKCFVLIDLKKNSVRHEDIGQMNMYLGYFAMEENMPDDNAPIGIILSKNKDELLVEYATYGMDSNLFVSKYELYLPNRKELEKLVHNILHDDI